VKEPEATEENKSQKPKNRHPKSEAIESNPATALETSASINIWPYQRQRFKISSSGKRRHRTYGLVAIHARAQHP